MKPFLVIQPKEKTVSPGLKRLFSVFVSRFSVRVRAFLVSSLAVEIKRQHIANRFIFLSFARESRARMNIK